MATSSMTPGGFALTRATPEQFQETTFDLAIIGAGINGAAVAREAALRGLSVAVIERDDFCEQTSAWNSRLAHGGLRYLEHGEIPLVYESLHDRESLLRIAPHLVSPMPFVVPLYAHNHLPGWMFRIGMVLYDVLSWRKSLPRHRRLGMAQVATEMPGMERGNLRGALHYYDGQITFPERLVVETLMDAAAHGAVIANHVTAEEIVHAGGVVQGIRARDLHSGTEFQIRARVVVNAAGPWVDDLDEEVGLDRQIGGTTGTHLVVDPFPGAPEATIYYEAVSDNRAILVIPWNGRYLIGTTDDRFEGDAREVRGTREEVEYLLAETNLIIPEACLTPQDVLLTYTGVRPLPYVKAAKTGNIPRSHIITAHQDPRGLVSIVGGKLTPHLSLGAETVDLILDDLLHRKLPASGTDRRSLPGAAWQKWASTTNHQAALSRSLPWPQSISDRLVRVYGGRVRDLVRIARERPDLAEVLGDGESAMVAAEIALAIESESALHLDDIIQRRAMVAFGRDLGQDVAPAAAEVAARVAGWDAERTRAELAEFEASRVRFRGGIVSEETAGVTPPG